MSVVPVDFQDGVNDFNVGVNESIFFYFVCWKKKNNNNGLISVHSWYGSSPDIKEKWGN